MKYLLYTVLIVTTAFLCCKQPSEAESYSESLNQYPTVFQNLESDIYYFQANNLIRYDHTTNMENVILSTQPKPYTVKCSGNRRFVFYVDNAWTFGQLKRFDTQQQSEVNMRNKVSTFFSSFDGDKIIYYGNLFDDGLRYYNQPVNAEYSLIDSTIQKYRKGDQLFYIVSQDTFDVTSSLFSGTQTDLIYNTDSTFAYYRNGYVLNAKTGEKRKLLEDKGDRTVYSIDFSPSGKQIVFSIYLVKATQSYVFVANADGSSPALISNKQIGSIRAVFVANY